MTTLRSVRLVLHLGRKQAAWSLHLRTDRAGGRTERRLSFGHLDYVPGDEGPHDVTALLRRAIAAVERQHGIEPAPEALREPRGAVGGDTTIQPLFGPTDPIPGLGQGLDGDAQDD